jgi:replicative DNA helicase
MSTGSKKPSAQTSPRVPPHNDEAEKSVLGCVLIDREAALYALGALVPGDFYSSVNAVLFTAMQAVFAASRPVDIITLSAELERTGSMAETGGMLYLTELTNFVPSAANHRHYCEIIKNLSVLRRLIAAGRNIIEKAYGDSTREEALAYAEKQIYDIGAGEDRGELRHVSATSGAVFERLELIHRDKSALRGVPTGFTELDRVTNGLQRSDLILIAARPSVGKTALGMNIIRNIARSRDLKLKEGGYYKFKCAVFSLEMSAGQLYQRMLCGEAGVSMSRAMAGELRRDDWTAVWAARKELDSGEIYIDDSSLITPAEILSKCRRLKIEKGLDAVLIDYLQLMYSGTRTDNRQSEIAEITRRLKVAAKELNVPVILLSQMSREVEKRPGHKPQLSDLRESGAIEQDADIVMFIHRKYDKNDESIPPEQRNEVELIIAKHRNGETRGIPLCWHGETVSFRNYSYEKKEETI